MAFSVSYELDWLNVVQILDANKIALKTVERGGAPLVVAGGPAVTMNPEPVAELLDIAFLGDGEGLAEDLAEAFEAASGYADFLDRLDGRPGIYIPARRGPRYEDGRLVGFSGEAVRPRACQPRTSFQTAARLMPSSAASTSPERKPPSARRSSSCAARAGTTGLPSEDDREEAQPGQDDQGNDDHQGKVLEREHGHDSLGGEGRMILQASPSRAADGREASGEAEGLEGPEGLSAG